MSETVKSLFISPEYLEGLSFSATLGEAQKLKVEFEFCIISLAKRDNSRGLGIAVVDLYSGVYKFIYLTERFLNIRIF